PVLDARRATPSVGGSLDRLARGARRALHGVLEAACAHVLASFGAPPPFAVRCLLDDQRANPSRNFALDIFYYPNEEEERGSTLNCDPHVDRGYLSALVVSRVEGLMLRNRYTGEWSRVRRIIDRFSRPTSPWL
ncbi:MAG: hypothetical protein SGPRY_008649, partial [Prymnesium sp.]